MRIIVIALTLVSAALAGTTVYFARELQLERERSRAVAATSCANADLPSKPSVRLPSPPHHRVGASGQSRRHSRMPGARKPTPRTCRSSMSRRTLKMLD